MDLFNFKDNMVRSAMIFRIKMVCHLKNHLKNIMTKPVFWHMLSVLAHTACLLSLVRTCTTRPEIIMTL